mgnify:CR=1 FL=1
MGLVTWIFNAASNKSLTEKVFPEATIKSCGGFCKYLQITFAYSSHHPQSLLTLIFPNLESANITYKLLKELDKVVSIGPIMMGLDKPVHIFQLGASVEEMVNMAAVAVVDAQEKLKNKLKVKSKK